MSALPLSTLHAHSSSSWCYLILSILVDVDGVDGGRKTFKNKLSSVGKIDPDGGAHRYYCCSRDPRTPMLLVNGQVRWEFLLLQ